MFYLKCLLGSPKILKEEISPQPYLCGSSIPLPWISLKPSCIFELHHMFYSNCLFGSPKIQKEEKKTSPQSYLCGPLFALPWIPFLMSFICSQMACLHLFKPASIFDPKVPWKPKGQDPQGEWHHISYLNTLLEASGSRTLRWELCRWGKGLLGWGRRNT